jgi:hypothetical protein
MATLVVMVGKITPKGTETVILHGALNETKKEDKGKQPATPNAKSGDAGKGAGSK